MAIQEYNPIWQQGDDLTFGIIWSESVGSSGPQPVDFEDGGPDGTSVYSVRMDIVSDEGVRLYTLNSDTIVDADPAEEGDQEDAVPVDIVTAEGVDRTIEPLEIYLLNGGIINVVVDRSLTLPGGAIYDLIAEGITLFNYDVFLRTAPVSDPTLGRQKKILKGQITVEGSWTLWA